MADVISFPKSAKDDDHDHSMPVTMKEAKASLETVKHVFINEVTEVLISTLTQQMMTGGFDILSDDHEKDFAFLIETIRSSLCKTVEIYHPFQDVAEKIMAEGTEPGVLIIADHINVKFQDEPKADDEPVLEAST